MTPKTLKSSNLVDERGEGVLLGIGSPNFLEGLLSGFRVVAIPELLMGSLFGIFESQGGRATPRDPPPISRMIVAVVGPTHLQRTYDNY